MRRLIQHGIAGVGAAGVSVVAAVTMLGSPSQAQMTLAVPAPPASLVTSSAPITHPSVSSPTPSSTAPSATKASSSAPSLVVPSATRPSTAAPTPASSTRHDPNRPLTVAAEHTDSGGVRVETVELVAQQADVREQTLGQQTKAIASQQAKLKKAVDRAEAARQKALANRGYLPGVTNPQEIAQQILTNKYSMGADQFACFDNIIMRESKYSITATNPSSGAYGIPQSLPGSKMASVGADWRTNPATQIIWGINYMNERYGSPCQAWGFKRSHGWY